METKKINEVTKVTTVATGDELIGMNASGGMQSISPANMLASLFLNAAENKTPLSNMYINIHNKTTGKAEKTSLADLAAVVSGIVTPKLTNSVYAFPSLWNATYNSIDADTILTGYIRLRANNTDGSDLHIPEQDGVLHAISVTVIITVQAFISSSRNLYYRVKWSSWGNWIKLNA